jgi:hypothetical protein
MLRQKQASRSGLSCGLPLLVLLLIGTCCGCVRRRMTVRTSPPGAMVYVDHQSIGTTPVSANFTYYGTRQFEIIKDGYRTEKFLRKFNPPWYEWPVLDFVSETLWPFEKRDERILDVQLSPDVNVPTEALIRSGEELRSQAAKGVAVAGPTTQVGIPASQLVIPTGPAPFIPALPPNPPIGPTSPILIPQTLPNAGPNFFDAPPSSLPATQVTPGPSYRQNLQ